jgi:hypothetical protein
MLPVGRDSTEEVVDDIIDMYYSEHFSMELLHSRGSLPTPDLQALFSSFRIKNVLA